MANRTTCALSLSGLVLAVASLSGCTSGGMESAARQELKANPAAGKPVSTMSAEALALQPAAEGGNTGPAPTVPGTTTPVPFPTFKVAVLSDPATPPTPAQAEQVMAARQQEALKAPAMPDTTADAAIPQVADAGAEDAAILAAQPSVIPSVVPTPRPGSALAYASATSSPALAALNSEYDISAPEPIDTPATAGPTVINSLIKKYAAAYKVPEALVHRVVHRESRYNPAAFNRGHYGLMQIKYSTAKSMGYSGPASGLFDAENNLKYAIKYLRGAWLVADQNNDGAVRLYARGYYYDAKRRGMLSVLR